MPFNRILSKNILFLPLIFVFATLETFIYFKKKINIAAINYGKRTSGFAKAFRDLNSFGC